jgi:ComF family protein
MHALICFIKQTVNYFLNFILDEDTSIFLLRKLGPEDFIKYLYNNCKPERVDIDNFNHVFSYQSKDIKNLIWQLKFNDNKKVADVLGLILAGEINSLWNTSRSAMNQQFAFSKGTLLIPIPIHSKRRRERGYNQCEWLCNSISQNLKSKNIIYRKDILKRVVYKKKQSWNKNKTDRLKSVGDIYKIKDSSELRGKNCILIDDVYTTGSTVNEARRMLLASGANQILILTIAH